LLVKKVRVLLPSRLYNNVGLPTNKIHGDFDMSDDKETPKTEAFGRLVRNLPNATGPREIILPRLDTVIGRQECPTRLVPNTVVV
jgi:hypothetical protein